MRTYLKALLLVGFATTQMLGAVPSVSAADLAVKRVKKVSVRVIHHRSLVVRDYDGTAIVLRRARPALLRDYAGTIIVNPYYEAIPVPGAEPRRYLNGQPVLPNYPRWWPHNARSYHPRFS